ncbi:MAG: FAD-binding protein [Geminicoccaceae bacterium]|nr:FAD-binding protein [Geminicoccaceae bacterium]
MRHERAIRAAAELLGRRLSTSRAVREHHGRGEGYQPVAAPDAVAFVRSTAEVAALVRLCAEHDVPIVPFGTGTSLEGHVAALRGGICIDTSAMDAVLEVNAADLDCLVQPGLTRKRLNDHLRDSGLFFPVDPGADASIGGMTATRASGTNAVRYGTMRENVLGLEVVLADGRVIRTGGRARKSAAGYDLTRLMVGSEGTLGVITAVRLRLHGIPEAVAAAVCAFSSVEAAVEAVMEIIQSGVPVARIELLDQLQMQASIAWSGLEGFAPRPTLFFEFHGTAGAVEEQSVTAQTICRQHDGTDFTWATRPEDRNRLWQARHDAYLAARALRPGKAGWATDVCVPISQLAMAVVAAQRDLAQSGLTAPIVGHVGDGNFHLQFIVDPDDPAEMRRAAEVNERLVARAIAVGGTCTGEHGVGYGKIASLRAEHGPAVEVMRTIKRALDPQDIMNPGKIVTPI